jgi:hypothetical protein
MTKPPMTANEIRVGVVVERRKAQSPWIDYTWRAIAALPGEPSAAPWTVMRSEGDVSVFYAGSAPVELHPSATANYRDNLTSSSPGLWVVLRPQEGDPPFRLFKVTADPAEGEAYTEAGNDLVDQVEMPPAIRAHIEAFVAEHHIERPFFKRKRQPADPESHARRPSKREGDA